MKSDKTQVTIKTYDSIVPDFLEYYDHGKSEVQFKEQLDFVAAQLPRGARILDAACGLGLQARYLSNLGFDVVAIDASANMIAQAKTFAPKCTFKVVDIRKLNFPPKSFDAVISFATLIHLDDNDCKKVMQNFHKLLKPDGVLLVNVKEHLEGEKEVIVEEPLNPELKTYFNRYSKNFIRDIFINDLKMTFLKEFNAGLFKPAAMEENSKGKIAKTQNQFTIIARK